MKSFIWPPEYLLYCMIGFGCLPVAAGVYRFKSIGWQLRLLLLLLTVSAVSILLQFLSGRHGRSNVWVSHFYSLIEYSLMIWVYSGWDNNSKRALLMQVSVIPFALFWIAAKIYLEKLTEPAVYTPTIARAILGCVSMGYIYYLNSIPKFKVVDSQRFWTTLATLTLCFGSITFFALRTQILWLPTDELWISISINWGVNILANCFYANSFLRTSV